MERLGHAAARIRSAWGNPHRTALVRALAGNLLDRGGNARAATEKELADHRDMTYRWLCSAQDATVDGGVAGFLDLVSGEWAPSYPETTGYIIPTFLSVAVAGLDASAHGRALRMAEWCSEIQMDDGAVLSGVMGTRRGPAVFNTGQSIFGWVAAYQASTETRFADSARAAAEWLLAHQDRDGAWRRHLSVLTTAPVHTYNSRCAWALAYAGAALEEERYTDAALRAADWVLDQQNDVGWFAHSGFAAGDIPLLHTISYVIEGLVGVHAFTGDRKYLDAACRGLDPLVTLREGGRLPGRLDDRWHGSVRWRCPTGEAQTALVLMRVDHLRPGNRYAETARRLISDVVSTQRALAGRTPFSERPGPAAGGVPGSAPIWGSYMRFQLPNWAAKFFLDAVLLQTRGVEEYGFPRLS